MPGDCVAVADFVLDSIFLLDQLPPPQCLEGHDIVFDP